MKNAHYLLKLLCKQLYLFAKPTIRKIRGGGGLYHLYYFVSVFSPFSKIDLDVESDFACICTIILFICHLGNVSLVLIFFLCLKFLFPFPVQSFHFKEGGSCFYRIMRQYHHIAGTWAWKNVRSYESKYMSLCL